MHQSGFRPRSQRERERERQATKKTGRTHTLNGVYWTPATVSSCAAASQCYYQQNGSLFSPVWFCGHFIITWTSLIDKTCHGPSSEFPAFLGPPHGGSWTSTDWTCCLRNSSAPPPGSTPGKLNSSLCCSQSKITQHRSVKSIVCFCFR